MIIDKIENVAYYSGIVKNLDKALAFICGNYDLPLGRHEFEGGAVIASEGNSLHLNQKEFEGHKSFADVMLVLEYDETISYRSISDLTLTKPYNPDTDCVFYDGKELDIVVTVPKGYFYIMMPGEGHKPCIHIHEEKPYKKYIVKCDQR